MWRPSAPRSSASGCRVMCTTWTTKRSSSLTAPPTRRAQLAAQLTEARGVALRYPTTVDALQSGYHLAGGFAPGTGAHYVSYSGLSGPGPVHVDRPEALTHAGPTPP